MIGHKFDKTYILCKKDSNGCLMHAFSRNEEKQHEIGIPVNRSTAAAVMVGSPVAGKNGLRMFLRRQDPYRDPILPA